MDVRKSQKCDVWEWTFEARRSISQTGKRRLAGAPSRAAGPKEAVAQRPRLQGKGIQLSDTIHLHDLTPAERLLEEAAERGFVEEKEIEALADEHELQDEESRRCAPRSKSAT